MSRADEYQNLTSESVVDALDGATVILPVGSVEQHGPHLPFAVDSLLAEHFANGVAERLGAWVLPVLSYGARSLPQSGGGLTFPGTVYLRGSTLLEVVKDILRSLSALSFDHLVILNGHFENDGFIFDAVDELAGQGILEGKSVHALSWWSAVDERWIAKHLPEFPGWHAEHAGLTETALLMHLRPDLVAPIRVDHDNAPISGVYVHPVDHASLTNRGVLSNTSSASAATGEALFGHVIDQITELVSTRYGVLGSEHLHRKAIAHVQEEIPFGAHL